MGRRRRWTDEELKEAVAGLYSMRAVLLRLGLRPLGSNYGTLRKRIAELGLVTTHWRGQGWLRGLPNTFHPVRSLEEVLQHGTTYPSTKLKRRLLGAGLMDAVCRSCGHREWLGGPIPLELDHIDGDVTNNTIQNLRLLCPNCHARTPTYRARNARYPNIPSLGEIQDGIRELGGIAAYARSRGVGPDRVRWWLRSDRLRRESSVGENGPQA